jgi:sodium transport system permease protein
MDTMLPPKIKAVYIKELRDSLRDRRVIVASVLVPVLIYPIMMLGMFEVMLSTRESMSHQEYAVAVPVGTKTFFEQLLKDYSKDEGLDEIPGLEPIGRASAPPMPDQNPGLAPAGGQSPASPGLTLASLKGSAPLLRFEEMSSEDAAKALAAGDVQAYVDVPADFEAKLKAIEGTEIEIRVDQAEHRSVDAEGRLKNLFEHLKKKTIAERLKQQNLTTAFVKPFTFKTQYVAAPAKTGGALLSFLPLMFIMMIITGSIYPAIDMTAGEKERKTLETLIGAPAKPLEIITGKFLAISTLALANAGLNVVSFASTFVVMIRGHSDQFQFPFQALPLTLLILIPLTLFFAAVLLAACSFASNNKEAQVYCLPIYLVPVVGMVLTMMPGVELQGPLLLAPVVNAALLIKELFLGHGSAKDIVFVFVSTCFYAAGMVALAARIFAREEVLFSAQGSMRLFLNRRFFKSSLVPKPGDALLLAAILFPAWYHFSNWLQTLLLNDKSAFSTALVVALPLYLPFLGLPFLAAWYLKLDFKSTFLWRVPSARAMLGAISLGCGSWIVATQIQSWQSIFWRLPVAELKMLENVFQVFGNSWQGTAAVIVLTALTPAICEEHFFRGFLQQGVLRKNKWSAFALVAFIFACFHIPLFRQPAVFTLGVALSYVAYEARSIWPGVVFHFLNNALPSIFSALGWLHGDEPKSGEALPGVPLQLLIPAVVLFVLGLVLVRGARAPKTAIESPASSAQPA